MYEKLCRKQKQPEIVLPMFPDGIFGGSGVHPQYGTEADLSRLDWMVAKDMAKAGRSGADICKAITEASPNIESRKAGHMEDYAQRTVNNVWKVPEVVEARQKLAIEQSHQRSHSRSRGFER